MTPDPRTLDDALQAATRLMESRARLAESIELDYSQFWGLDPRDLGIGDTPGFELPGGFGVGLTYMNRRKRGEFIPAFLNEQQLRLYRQRIRAMCVGNAIALNVIGAHQSYGVGEGFRYEASVRKGFEDAPGVHGLVEQVQVWIDAFCEHNDLPSREAEISSRIDVDGEAILRLFPRESGVLSVRTVEPEHVYSPTGDSGDDSFGVRNAPGDVETPTGYWIVTGVPDQGARPELVDASEVWHLKSQETPRTSKRGLSDFYAVYGEIRAAGDLLKSLVSMAKARSKIAWVEKMEGSTIDVAVSLAAAQAAATVIDPVTGATVNMERWKDGSVLRTNSDIEFPASQISASDYLEVYAADLRLIAGRFAMPEYMLTADASNANYSSTLVAESPFVKKMQRRQNYLAKALALNRYPGPNRSLLWRQVAFAVEMGLLSRAALRAVDIQATGPTLTVRDVAKEAQVDQIYHGLGVKSLTTIQLEQSLDPDEQSANFAKEQKARQEASPGQLPDVPGLSGQEQTSPDQQQEQPPAPTRESKDAQGHEHAANGQFGSGGTAKGDGGGEGDGGGGDKAAASKAARILDFAKGAPAAVARKVKEQVGKKYASLSARYGSRYAKAIVAAGIAGVPLPVPGSSFITAAPVLALAELHRMLSRPKGALAESKGAEMTPEQIGDAARELVAELYRDFGVERATEGYTEARYAALTDDGGEPLWLTESEVMALRRLRESKE